MPTAHEKLFEEYLEELSRAKGIARAWWDGLIDRETKRRGDENEAITSIRRRWPLGAASHPVVIAVLRKYYLACNALNENLARSGRNDEEVYPNHFVADWLINDDTLELAEFVSILSYWPIGLTDNIEVV